MKKSVDKTVKKATKKDAKKSKKEMHAAYEKEKKEKMEKAKKKKKKDKKEKKKAEKKEKKKAEKKEKKKKEKAKAKKKEAEVFLICELCFSKSIECERLTEIQGRAIFVVEKNLNDISRKIQTALRHIICYPMDLSCIFTRLAVVFVSTFVLNKVGKKREFICVKLYAFTTEP